VAVVTTGAVPPGTRVSTGSVPRALEGVVQRSACTETDGDALLLRLPHVGRLLARHGDEVTIDAPDAHPDAVRRYLHGPIAAALHQQRGHIVLRGAALSDGRRTIVLVGRAGAAVPPVAISLLRTGWRLVAAEPCAIDGVRVVGGSSRLGLWPDDAARLQLEASQLAPRQPDSPILDFDVAETSSSSPDVRHIVVLCRGLHSSDVEVQHPAGADRFLAITPVTHRDLAQGEPWLGSVSTMLDRVEVTTLRWPGGLELNEVVRLVRETIA
jgi:hypothetical protein